MPEGFGFECVSAAELDAVRAAFPTLAPTRVLFTPSFAPRDEYEAALGLGVRVTLDSLHPLQHWPELFRAQADACCASIRATARATTTRCVTGGSEAKFGLPLADIGEFRRRRARPVRASPACTRTSAAASSSPGTGREVYARLVELAEQFARLHADRRRRRPRRPLRGPTAAARPRSVRPRAGRGQGAVSAVSRLWIEPGRYLVAEAGVLLAAVTQVKRKHDYVYVGIDTGMNSLIRPALYEAWHEIVNLRRLGEKADAVCEVVGPICESGDILGRRRRLPRHRGGRCAADRADRRLWLRSWPVATTCASPRRRTC